MVLRLFRRCVRSIINLNAFGQFLYEYNIHHIQQNKRDNKVDDGDHLCSILAKESHRGQLNYRRFEK